ncbi:hypothetical protein [Variovorax paradoxus]|uniref:hypothetical protein n=1 Tax=Variovorax paradoxus TaxID=34073 RepID=UPI003D64D21B
MEILDWVKRVKGFAGLSINDKILAFGYFFHTERKVERFFPANINSLFDDVHFNRPSNTPSQMKALTTTKPKRLLVDGKGYRLSADARDKIAAMLPPAVTPKQVTVELKKLEALVTDPAQKTFLEETIICFSQGAYRASIVMAWNLAYHHVCTFIFNHHLTTYNGRLPINNRNEKPIGQFADFEKTTERVVIEVAKGANIINKTTYKTLDAKLDIRNTAAHPSSASIQPITAEEVITDLVQNILLKKPL